MWWSRQRSHPRCQALQLVQDGPTPGLMIHGDTAHVLEQLLVGTSLGHPPAP